MDGGAWWATVHVITKSRTRLSDFTFIFSSLGPAPHFLRPEPPQGTWLREAAAPFIC